MTVGAEERKNIVKRELAVLTARANLPLNLRCGYSGRTNLNLAICVEVNGERRLDRGQELKKFEKVPLLLPLIRPGLRLYVLVFRTRSPSGLTSPSRAFTMAGRFLCLRGRSLGIQ